MITPSQHLELPGSHLNTAAASLTPNDTNTTQYFYGQNSPIAGNPTSSNGGIENYQQQSYLPSLPVASSANKINITQSNGAFSGNTESWLSYI